MNAPSVDGPRSPGAGATRPIRHALDLLRAFSRVSAVTELQYGGNFVASLLGTVFWMTMAVLTVAVFFEHTSRLGGWSIWEAVVLLGVFNALAGVVETALRPGLGTLADDVRHGTLDLILMRPVDAQLFITFRHLDIWRLADVILGLGMAAYAIHHVGHRVSGAQGTAFVIAFSSAVAVLYALWAVLMCLSFWFTSIENLSTVFDAVFESARYPASAYPGALRVLFVYVIPVAWMTTVPASALVGRLSLAASVETIGVAVVGLAVSRVVWVRGLRRYASAGG